MKILKLKVMLIMRLKEEERKHNFHVEKDSLDEKVLGFWVMLFVIYPTPMPNSTKTCLVSQGVKTRLKFKIFYFPYDQLKLQLYMKVIEQIYFYFTPELNSNFVYFFCSRL